MVKMYKLSVVAQAEVTKKPASRRRLPRAIPAQEQVSASLDNQDVEQVRIKQVERIKALVESNAYQVDTMALAQSMQSFPITRSLLYENGDDSHGELSPEQVSD